MNATSLALLTRVTLVINARGVKENCIIKVRKIEKNNFFKYNNSLVRDISFLMGKTKF